MTSATTPPPSTHSAATADRGRGRWKFALFLVALLIAAFVVHKLPDWDAQAETGAAYGARMACSCRFVQGRSLESCRSDAEPGMEIVTIEEVEGRRAIRASVPILASRTASYAGATGCLLDPE